MRRRSAPSRGGDFNLRCLVERIGGRFTLFLSDGTPVRATLNVSLKEFVDVAVEVGATPSNRPTTRRS